MTVLPPAPQQVPPPSRTIDRPGVLRSLEEKLRQHISRSVGLCFAACETGADAIWLRGRERHTGEPVSAFYFGSGGSFAGMVAKLYVDYEVQRRHDGLRIWSAPGYLREARVSVDMCFADLPWPYSRLYAPHGLLHIPGWIVQKIALPETWDGVLRQLRKNTKTTDLRKIRKYRLEYDTSRAATDVDHFYDAMYAPYTRRRFGSLAYIEDREDIHATARRGELLRIRHEGCVVGGAVLYRWRRTLHFLWFGILLELEEGLMDAVQSAIYLFSIQHAYEQGCTELNLSLTLPLLNDGVYRYKRKWGAGVHDAWRFAEIVARPVNFTDGVRSFIARHPMIVRERNRLVGKILCTDPADAGAIAKLIDSYASPGLDALKLFFTHPLPTGFDAPAGASASLFDLSKSDDPARDFCRL